MKKNILYTIIIIIITVILKFISHIWIKNNLFHLPPPWDQSAYLYMVFFEYETLINTNFLQFVKTIFNQSPHIAPLFPPTAIPFITIFGLDIYTPYLANSLYLFILLFSTFFISKKINNTKSAFLSIFIIATFPAIIAFSRDFLYEFPLAAMIALSYLFFLYSESFKNRYFSILFGVSSVLTLMTKTMGIVFLIMPYLYSIYVFIKTNDSKKRINIILCLLSTIAIASIYYIPNLKYIFKYLYFYGIGEGSKNFSLGTTDIVSLKYWTVYLENIVKHGISICYSLIFIISMIAFILDKNRTLSRNYILVWLWLIMGYIFLSIPINKGGERYALPILCPIAIIMSLHISKISIKPLKNALIIIIIIVGTINYIYQTYSQNCEYRPLSYKNIVFQSPVHYSCRMQNDLNIPSNKQWEIKTLLYFMDTYSNRKINIFRVLVGVDHNFLNINTLRLFAITEKLKGNLNSYFQFENLSNITFDEKIIKRLIDTNHFIITKSGYQGPKFSNKNNIILKNFLKNYKPINTFIINDGSIVSIYTGGLLESN